MVTKNDRIRVNKLKFMLRKIIARCFKAYNESKVQMKH